MSAHAWDIRSWREFREADLRQEFGWLSLVGLFWLQEGDNPIGGVTDSAVALPKLPATSGAVRLRGQQAFLIPAPGAKFTIGDQAVQAETELRADDQGAPTEVRVGDYSLTIIRRSGQLAVRARDKASPVRTGFRGLSYFPDNPGLALTGSYSLFPSPQEFKVTTAIGREEAESYNGTVEFSYRGKSYKVQAQERSGGQLFITFRDATSGKTSYGACRFLLCPRPVDGKVDLDFNRAYNPPCSFTPYATCSLPHPDNRLDFPVEAGETKPLE